MDTYDLESEIQAVSKTVRTSEQLLDSYISLGEKTVDVVMRLQSLEEAVEQIVPEQILVQVKEIRDYLYDEYANRYVTAEDIDQLESYGYRKPVVVCTKEEAIDFFAKGTEVLLLFTDGTDKVVENPLEISDHISAGGIVAVTQLAIDKSLNGVGDLYL